MLPFGKDNLELFDGNSNTSPSMANLSGQFSDLETTVYQTSGRSLSIEFQSDGMLASKGFKANFTFVSTIGTTDTTSTATSVSTTVVTTGVISPNTTNTTSKFVYKNL